MLTKAKPRHPGRKAFEKQLKPIMERAREERGFVSRLTSEMNLLSRGSGKEWSRQEIERWLGKDPTRRVEPSYSSGLLLMRAVANLG